MMGFSSFWNKADENKNAAQLCIENDFYNACANRAYYSMYHAAIAILIARGFPPTQKQIDHNWVQSTFARELINRKKIFPGKIGKYLLDAQIIRNDADYDEASINKKKAKRQLTRCQEFIVLIKSV